MSKALSKARSKAPQSNKEQPKRFLIGGNDRAWFDVYTLRRFFVRREQAGIGTSSWSSSWAGAPSTAEAELRPGRLPTSRTATREAPHKQNYDQGGSPQAELRPGMIPTSKITTREVPHKPNYDQGSSPQAELRPGRLPTSRNTTQGAPLGPKGS